LPNEKVIATIGVSDEDMAHLRLLMRKAATELSCPWRWGSDTGADLLVVDPSNFAGQMARTRAKTSGMRVAVVCDLESSTEGDPAFYRPFKIGNVIGLLNGISGAPAPAANLSSAENMFLPPEADADGDLRLLDPAFPEEPAKPHGRDAHVAVGLDELIRGNPLADPFFNLQPAKLDESTSIGNVGGLTRRSELRADRERESQAVPLSQQAPPRNPGKTTDSADRSAHRLREYLEGSLIGGPVQIAWPDAGILTLDPKNRVYHSAQTLRELEIYCRQSPRRDDWRRLTSAELTEIRETQPSQPYEKLVWLDVLLHSAGKLASNLDPGGTYELVRWLEIARDYPHYARISAAMMQPVRLHELAASCACSMGEVFAVVNAYDAIGCLKKTPRPSRHAEAEQDKSRPSFLQRLRKPFGKS
jgi:hypothetical protein